MTKFYKGIAGKRENEAKGIVIHNDAGTMNANAAFYREWLPTHDAENGFAHVYIGSDDRFQAEDYINKAWHTANRDGNNNYIGWEICQSLGDEKTFLNNEQKTFKDIADYMKTVNMRPNRETVRLHKEFSATACPHRSWELHGKSVNAVKDYCISQIQKYLENSGPIDPHREVQPLVTGKKVTVLYHATHWSPSSKASKISQWVKGSSFDVVKERAINYSYSKWEYCIVNNGVILGWILSQDINGGDGSKEAAQSMSQTPLLKGSELPDSGTYTLEVATNLRTGVGTHNSIIALLPAGSIIKYDSKIIFGDYVWLRQPRATGYGYIAVV